MPLVSWSRVVGFSCHGGYLLELYRDQHAVAAVAALSVMKDLQVLKIALASSTRVRQRCRFNSSTCIRDQNASIMALS